jgi:hypothetical protein
MSSGIIDLTEDGEKSAKSGKKKEGWSEDAICCLNLQNMLIFQHLHSTSVTNGSGKSTSALENSKNDESFDAKAGWQVGLFPFMV